MKLEIGDEVFCWAWCGTAALDRQDLNGSGFDEKRQCGTDRVRRGDAAVPRDRDFRRKICCCRSGDEQDGSARLNERGIECVAETRPVLFLYWSEHDEVGQSRGERDLIREVSLNLAKRRGDCGATLAVLNDLCVVLARRRLEEHASLTRCFACGALRHVHDLLNNRRRHAFSIE